MLFRLVAALAGVLTLLSGADAFMSARRNPTMQMQGADNRVLSLLKVGLLSSAVFASPVAVQNIEQLFVSPVPVSLVAPAVADSALNPWIVPGGGWTTPLVPSIGNIPGGKRFVDAVQNTLKPDIFDAVKNTDIKHRDGRFEIVAIQYRKVSEDSSSSFPMYYRVCICIKDDPAGPEFIFANLVDDGSTVSIANEDTASNFPATSFTKRAPVYAIDYDVFSQLKGLLTSPFR